MNFVQVLVASGYTGCPGVSSVPFKLINIISTVITVMKFGIPILLIIFGMLDLGKAVVASKEDDIKKGQQMFIKRIIAAILVFFVVVVVQLVVSLAASNDTEADDIWNCVNAFIKGVDETTGKVKG